MSLKNNKSLGQHWLNDRTILNAIADLAIPRQAGNPSSADAYRNPAQPTNDKISAEPLFEGMRSYDEHERQGPVTTGALDAPREKMVQANLVVEIGPGLGTLTSSLLRRFAKVIAVEYDPRLAKNLPNSFPGKNLEVINADFLKFDLGSIKDPYVVAGNIPYYITSPIITKLLDTTNQPKRIVLLIQKEVADRILSTPGKHTYLSLSVQSKAEVEPGFIVPRSYFTPPPKVDSAVIILTPRKIPLLSDDALSLAKQGFSNPRKKLIKNLPYEKSVLESIFKELKIPETARPSDLDHETWKKLKKSLDKIKQ